METKTTELSTWEFAEANLVDAIGLTVRCHNKECNNAWTVRLNPAMPLKENLRIISIQRYICMDCSKKLEPLKHPTEVVALT